MVIIVQLSAPGASKPCNIHHFYYLQITWSAQFTLNATKSTSNADSDEVHASTAQLSINYPSNRVKVQHEISQRNWRILQTSSETSSIYGIPGKVFISSLSSILFLEEETFAILRMCKYTSLIDERSLSALQFFFINISIFRLTSLGNVKVCFQQQH